MCLCSTICQLAETFDPDRALGLVSGLNLHLSAIRTILAKSKSLSRDVGYQIVPNNPRTAKVLSARASDPKTTAQILHRYGNDVSGFWSGSDVPVPADLRRRLACIAIDLRSNLDAQAWVPPGLASFVQGQKVSELRYAGKKYIKMARRLGGIGSMVWLPLDVPSSTYERYLNMDDDEAFNHLRSLAPSHLHCDDFVRKLIASQFTDLPSTVSKYDLYHEFGDLFPKPDRVMLLLSAFRGATVPVDLLRSVRQPQRRWGPDGEIKTINATDFGIPSEMVEALSDETCLELVGASPNISVRTLDDGTTVWSLDNEWASALMNAVSPHTKEAMAANILKLLCFACPACYEGKVNWPRDKKKATWSLLDKATDKTKIHSSQKTQVIDALLFFAERDFFTVRRVATDRARLLLQRSMPSYYHASVTLFESIMLRLEGSFDKSTTKIRDFLDRNRDPGTRCENALRGRLHVSWIENKVHQYDNDVASVIYDWEGILPLSTFEIEVTRRLQGTAAKFFHSIGDFQMARASLEQHLSLVLTQPIRENTRLLITTKLAEIHCELLEHEKAHDLSQREINNMPDAQRKTRPFRRLAMASVEVDLGWGRLDAAEPTLQQLAEVEPPELDDLNDQVLHMRRLMLVSRAAHERLRFQDALDWWRFTLQRMEVLSIFSTRHPWTAAVIFVSLAHAQLALGDIDGAKQSWARGAEVSRTERCEYVIPTLATVWVPKIVGDVLRQQGWPFRMMLPGGRPDVTWS
ncbi:hypothetical protein TPAR_01484 [Tolypocladium paradoxum]|uniref:Uncharacterized protein n=1 Tax=Tolypocladium paradoxum TaxID=94208 RepID=A0A2S4L7D9_9HYPO|nr:hypothetical protein TPAR_01484 [Tolypocladium paradoxum]